MTTQQAESLVERQARAFEQAKPSFTERWRSGEGLKARRRKRRTTDKKPTKQATNKGQKA